jgi:hypothetical protein
MMGAAAPTGLLVPNAEASLLAKRRDEEDADDIPLLLTPSDDDVGAGLVGHRSHSSHRSHRSHSSHRSHYSGSFHDSSSGTGTGQTFVAPRPASPKPAVISLVAVPGGRIFVDGKLVGTDATGPVALAAGSHTVRIENRFLGTGVVEVNLNPGQTGVIDVKW